MAIPVAEVSWAMAMGWMIASSVGLLDCTAGSLGWIRGYAGSISRDCRVRVRHIETRQVNASQVQIHEFRCLLRPYDLRGGFVGGHTVAPGQSPETGHKPHMKRSDHELFLRTLAGSLLLYVTLH